MEVLTEFDDGRLNILVEGGERFRVHELTSGRSFQTGRTSPLLDDDDPADEDDDRARSRALRAAPRADGERGRDAAGRLAAALLSRLPARVELDPEVKQGLLQGTSERVRLERVCELLVDATGIVERHRRAAERAATNGRVDLS